MSYPMNRPLPPGTYRWTLTMLKPGNGRWPCNGTYSIAPGDTRTGVDVLEEMRIYCARQIGIPLHSAQASDFTLHG
ncbi:hypothetical protein [Streptomyces sp. ISBFB 2968]|uniref:hypothetical protein n=1 Tax=Streptomyces sp. ISBFB 2968 TaxID=2903527 RepID=UPI002FDBA899